MDFYSKHSIIHLVSAMRHPQKNNTKAETCFATPFIFHLFMYIYVYMWLVRLWKFIFMTYMFVVIKLLYTCGPCRISSFYLFLYFFPSMQYIHSPVKMKIMKTRRIVMVIQKIRIVCTHIQN